MKKTVFPAIAVFLAAGAASAMDGMEMEKRIHAYVASPAEMTDAAESYNVELELQRFTGRIEKGEVINAYVALPEEMVDSSGSYNVENDLKRFLDKSSEKGERINVYIASPEEMVDAAGSYSLENDLKRFGIE
ncbi:hypothetical protein EP073_05950 [Geovibrio thiophilus]|uniref:Uncharacterized protein n=1 Tax=Geovibrio thiophilus TaxID=139438 RepID=A0A3R5UXJ3_9BACT|nr:hypothetical protein [Geovibrio thiophilus]QAR32966.1 hypothetical protein EP073_05950 [Geovibrio thiophilus]